MKDTPANRALSPEMTPQNLFTKKCVQKRAYFADHATLVFNGDVKANLKYLAKHDIQVDCIVTSPPFYGQRDYGVAGQIGLERHPRVAKGRDPSPLVAASASTGHPIHHRQKAGVRRIPMVCAAVSRSGFDRFSVCFA